MYKFLIQLFVLDLSILGDGLLDVLCEKFIVWVFFYIVNFIYICGVLCYNMLGFELSDVSTIKTSYLAYSFSSPIVTDGESSLFTKVSVLNGVVLDIVAVTDELTESFFFGVDRFVDGFSHFFTPPIFKLGYLCITCILLKTWSLLNLVLR